MGRWLFQAQRALLVLFAVLAVGAVVFSYVGTLQVRDVVACQSRFNMEFREALLVRDAISGDVQEAQRRLLAAVARSGSTPKQVYEEYLATLRRAEDRLQSHPLPQNYCEREGIF